MENWWPSDASEPYWLEITDRPNPGDDLWNYRFRKDGHDLVPTLLLDEMVRGDSVLHYDKKTLSIVGMSTVTRDRAVPRPGEADEALGREIDGYRNFEPISLETIRRHDAALSSVYGRLLKEHGRPLRFPFTWRSGEELRPAQVYIAKFPAAAVRAVPELLAAVEGRQPRGRGGKALKLVDTRKTTSD